MAHMTLKQAEAALASARRWPGGMGWDDFDLEVSEIMDREADTQ